MTQPAMLHRAGGWACERVGYCWGAGGQARGGGTGNWLAGYECQVGVTRRFPEGEGSNPWLAEVAGDMTRQK